MWQLRRCWHHAMWPPGLAFISPASHISVLQDVSGVGHGRQWWDPDKSRSREWGQQVSGQTWALPPAHLPPAPLAPVSPLEAATARGGGHADLWRGQSQTEAKPRAVLAPPPCITILEGLWWMGWGYPGLGVWCWAPGIASWMLALCQALSWVPRAPRTEKCPYVSGGWA